MRYEQFESYEAAIDYLSARGKLTYQGRVGHMAEACLYRYECKGMRYQIWVYLDGRVEVTYTYETN